MYFRNKNVRDEMDKKHSEIHETCMRWGLQIQV